MKTLFIPSLILSSLLLVLTGCLGGGSSTQSSSTTSAGTYINVDVCLCAGQYQAVVYVNDSSLTGTPISNAVVTINGQTLKYTASNATGVFTGNVLPDAYGKLNLSVLANGQTYTAVQGAPDSLPVLIMPSALYAASTNTITWLPNISATGLTPTSYYLTVSASGSSFPLFQSNAITGTTETIPANYLAAGTSYCMAVSSFYGNLSIANTAPTSNFVVWATPTSTCKLAV